MVIVPAISSFTCRCFPNIFQLADASYAHDRPPRKTTCTRAHIIIITIITIIIFLCCCTPRQVEALEMGAKLLALPQWSLRGTGP